MRRILRHVGWETRNPVPLLCVSFVFFVFKWVFNTEAQRSHKEHKENPSRVNRDFLDLLVNLESCVK